MPRQIKPAPRHWWWPRVTPGFVVLCLALLAGFAGMTALHLGSSTYYLLAFLWLPVGLLIRQRARLARRVLSRPGVTCPCCLHELEPDAPSCDRCRAGHGRSAYTEYWSMVAEAPAMGEPWWRALNKAEGVRGRSTHLTLTARWQVGLLAAGCVLTVAGTIVLRPATLLAMDMLWTLPLYLALGVGLWINYNYGSRRAGSSLHCAQCDYQIDPARLEMTTCTECGSGLTGRDQTAVGRRIGHRGFTFLGYGLMIGTGLLYFTSVLGGIFFDTLSPKHYLPVSLYVEDALGGDADYKTWDVLETRYVKPADVQRLVDAFVVWTQEEDTQASYRYSHGICESLAFQLDGPHATPAMKQQVALALLANSGQGRLFTLNDWLDNYLQTLTKGSAEYGALLAATEESFFEGTLDYMAYRWLDTQHGLKLRTAFNLPNFLVYMLKLEQAQSDSGPTFVVKPNPAITLSADDRPQQPMRVYLRGVQPRYGSSVLRILDLEYEPLAEIGQNTVLASTPCGEDTVGAIPARLIYLVAVGDNLPHAHEIRWSGDLPLLTHPQRAQATWYGPYELHTGMPIARELP